MAATEADGRHDDLVLQARTDSQALGRLYDLYYERIFRFCVHRLFVREAAEDVTSEVFLAVARKIRTFGGATEDDFRNWVYAIAANLTNAYVRKVSHRAKALAAAAEAGALDGRQCNDDGPAVDWPVLHQAILGLNPRHQAIIVLRFFEHLTHAQIAAILGVRGVTVRVSLSRALRQLRKSLQTAFEGGR